MCSLMQSDRQQYRQSMGCDCLNYFIDTHIYIVALNLLILRSK
jgi:hypothetical protein